MIILKNSAQIEEHFNILKSQVVDICQSAGDQCYKCIMNKYEVSNFCLRISIREILIENHSRHSDINFHENYEVFYNILTLIDVKCEYKICVGCPFYRNKKCILPKLKKFLDVKYIGDDYASQ